MYTMRSDQKDLLEYMLNSLEPRYHEMFPDYYGNAGYAKKSLSLEAVVAMMENALKTGKPIPYSAIYDFDVDFVKSLEARGISVDL